MSDGFYVSSIGMQAQQRALDVIANNIANVNTSGFKRVAVRFADLAAAPVEGATPAADMTADEGAPAGVSAVSERMLNQTGEIQHTGGTMDLAIQGNGFIEVMGPDGQTLLWRGGTLKVNADGMLATDGGQALRAAISVPADASALTIASDGTVRATVPNASDPVELGQITLARLDDATGVEALDGGLYRVGDDTKLVTATPGEDGTGIFAQGSIERSNVSLNDEMVQLMLVQRAYAANAQIVQAADQLMAIANGLRR